MNINQYFRVQKIRRPKSPHYLKFFSPSVTTEKPADVHSFLYIKKQLVLLVTTPTKAKKCPALFNFQIFKSTHLQIVSSSAHSHIKNPHIYLTTSNSFFNLISSDDCPIITINLPGSTVQFMFLSRMARSSGCRVKVTVFFSPGLRPIRSKPRRS